MPQLLIPLADGTTMALELESIVTVGRNPANALPIDDPSVSSFHAKIETDANGVFVSDLFSSNGTYVNGERILTLKLEDGDRVRFGKVESVFSLSGGA